MMRNYTHFFDLCVIVCNKMWVALGKVTAREVERNDDRNGHIVAKDCAKST